jgi:hypothetical protein
MCTNNYQILINVGPDRFLLQVDLDFRGCKDDSGISGIGCCRNANPTNPEVCLGPETPADCYPVAGAAEPNTIPDVLDADPKSKEGLRGRACEGTRQASNDDKSY